MALTAETVYRPPGFQVCPPPPQDAVRVSGPTDAGDGWTLIVLKDYGTGITYYDYEYEGPHGVEWIWYCGVEGQNVKQEDLIDATNLSWDEGHTKIKLWALLGAVGGAALGLGISAAARGNKLLYGGVGAVGGAVAGHLTLKALRSKRSGF